MYDLYRLCKISEIKENPIQLIKTGEINRVEKTFHFFYFEENYYLQYNGVAFKMISTDVTQISDNEYIILNTDSGFVIMAVQNASE